MKHWGLIEWGLLLALLFVAAVGGYSYAQESGAVQMTDIQTFPVTGMTLDIEIGRIPIYFIIWIKVSETAVCDVKYIDGEGNELTARLPNQDGTICRNGPYQLRRTETYKDYPDGTRSDGWFSYELIPSVEN